MHLELKTEVVKTLQKYAGSLEELSPVEQILNNVLR